MELSQGLRDRLDSLEARMKARGVVDMKFFRVPGFTPEQYGSDIADVLEAVLDGEHKPFAGCGDSVRNIRGCN